MSGSNRDLATIQPIPRADKPDYCLNVGITWPGMIALELEERLPTFSFKSFGAFVAGQPNAPRWLGT